MPTKHQWEIQCFGGSTLFFPTFEGLKTWFELSRVKLYRNGLRGNKNCFELAGGSSYRGKITVIYDGNPGEIDFGSSSREVRVSEGSSYRESTVTFLHCA